MDWAWPKIRRQAWTSLQQSLAMSSEGAKVRAEVKGLVLARGVHDLGAVVFGNKIRLPRLQSDKQ